MRFRDFLDDQEEAPEGYEFTSWDNLKPEDQVWISGIRGVRGPFYVVRPGVLRGKRDQLIIHKSKVLVRTNKLGLHDPESVPFRPKMDREDKPRLKAISPDYRSHLAGGEEGV